SEQVPEVEVAVAEALPVQLADESGERLEQLGALRRRELPEPAVERPARPALGDEHRAAQDAEPALLAEGQRLRCVETVRAQPAEGAHLPGGARGGEPRRAQAAAPPVAPRWIVVGLDVTVDCADPKAPYPGAARVGDRRTERPFGERRDAPEPCGAEQRRERRGRADAVESNREFARISVHNAMLGSTLFSSRRCSYPARRAASSIRSEGQMRTVTKKELVNRVAEKANVTKVVAKEIIQSFLDAIIEELAAGNRLEFREFG